MKILYNGIHKKLSFLIQHCNGYNKEYHITSLSKKLNIDILKIRELFNESLSDNILSYIKLLENGINVDEVIKLAIDDRQKIRKRLISTTTLMNNIIQKTDIGKIF